VAFRIRNLLYKGEPPVPARRLAKLTLILFALGAGSLPALSQDTSSHVRRGDEKFMKQAIQDNYAEIQLGKLAEETSQNPGIKSMGRTLAADHEKANAEAIKAADQLGIKAPTGPNPKQQRQYQRLQKESGAAFDRDFARSLVKAHKEAISEYKHHAEGDNAVARYAGQQLPVLKKHEQHAESLKKSLGVASAAPTTP
jgi:putative membrane protein